MLHWKKIIQLIKKKIDRVEQKFTYFCFSPQLGDF